MFFIQCVLQEKEEMALIWYHNFNLQSAKSTDFELPQFPLRFLNYLLSNLHIIFIVPYINKPGTRS